MPIQSFDEWKTAQNNPTTSSPIKAGKVQSFDEWKKTQPVTPVKPPLSTRVKNIATKVGDAVSNVLPGLRAGVDSIVNKSTQPYKDFAKKQFKVDEIKSFISNPVKSFKDSSLITGKNKDGTSVTQDQILKEGTDFASRFIGNGPIKLSSKTVPVISAGIETKVPIKTPPKTPLLVKSETPIAQKVNINTPHVPDAQLPVIDMGPKPKSPTTAMDVAKVKPPEVYPYSKYKVEPEAIPQIPKTQPIPRPITRSVTTPTPVVAKQAPILTKPVAQINKYDQSSVPLHNYEQPQTTSRLTPIPGTGPVRTRGLATSVEQKAVENNLIKSLGQLPDYQQMNVAEQARIASDIIANDFERAKRIAMGQEMSPPGLHPEAMFTAVAERAKKDPTFLRKLATESSLVSEGTTMGQRIRLLAELNPDSPLSAVMNIQKTFDDVATKKYGNIKQVKNQVVNQIKEEIKKTTPKVEDWNSFIDGLTC